MGKIQSAITGLVMTSLGSAVSQNEAKKAQALKSEQEEPDKEGQSLYGEAFEGANEKQQANLVKRQEEAMDITNQYIRARKYQMDAFKSRLSALEEGSPEASKVMEEESQAHAELLKEHQEKMAKLKKRVYKKKGTK